jgi:hypothetical protein
MKLNCPKLVCICFCFAIFFSTKAQTTSNKATSHFGYLDKGDSISFIFGEQQSITIGTTEVTLTIQRLDQIKQVNVAGEFNGWDNQNSLYQLVKINNHLYMITVSKHVLGKIGETKQFKFVLNHQYWIEPPVYALNKFTGKDGNTNLLVKL